jgi:anti-sigma factor RsiW
MRCRKVRSYLSAYCRNELSGRRHRAVAEHLDVCPECRREEAVFREINGYTAALPRHEVSADFNATLLSRIAQERFKKTRARAYLPKRAPVFTRGQLIPAVASACLVLVFALFGGIGILDNQHEPGVYADRGRSVDDLDDSYRTVQPAANHTLTQHAKAQWAFEKQVARASRIRNLMNTLANRNRFESGAVQFAGDRHGTTGNTTFLRLPFDSRTGNRANSVPETRTAEEAQ